MLEKQIKEERKYHPTFWKEYNEVLGHPIPSETERIEREENPVVPELYPEGML